MLLFLFLPSAVAAGIAALLFFLVPPKPGAPPTRRPGALRATWRRRGSYLVPAAAGGVVIAVATLLLLEGRTAAGFAPAEQNLAELPAWLVYTLYFVAMIVGMLCQALFEAIRNRQGGDPPRIDLWRLVLPLLISPMVFGVIVGQLPESPTIQVVFLSLSFQNGFFWQNVVDTAGRPAPKPALGD